LNPYGKTWSQISRFRWFGCYMTLRPDGPGPHEQSLPLGRPEELGPAGPEEGLGEDALTPMVCMVCMADFAPRSAG